jgi:hypothetical protein
MHFILQTLTYKKFPSQQTDVCSILPPLKVKPAYLPGSEKPFSPQNTKAE